MKFHSEDAIAAASGVLQMRDTHSGRFRWPQGRGAARQPFHGRHLAETQAVKNDEAPPRPRISSGRRQRHGQDHIPSRRTRAAAVQD